MYYFKNPHGCTENTRSWFLRAPRAGSSSHRPFFVQTTCLIRHIVVPFLSRAAYGDVNPRVAPPITLPFCLLTCLFRAPLCFLPSRKFKKLHFFLFPFPPPCRDRDVWWISVDRQSLICPFVVFVSGERWPTQNAVLDVRTCAKAPG